VLWIVSGLWRVHASNVLKWYCGASTVTAISGDDYASLGADSGWPDCLNCLLCRAFSAVPVNLEVTIIFPLVLAICWWLPVGTFLTKPEEDAVLMDFYAGCGVGFWGPC